LTIADEFPASVNNTDSPTDLKSWETPDGYGYSITNDGLLAKNTTMPLGTTRISRSVSITTTNYNWYYRRLWRINGTTLDYYAPDYDDVLVRQKSSRVPFNEDTNNIVEIVPFGGDNMCVAKRTGSYILGNIVDDRALFTKTDIVQELRCLSSDYITELDGRVFVSNDKGLFTWESGQSVEVTRKVRKDLSSFSSLPLKVDYEHKWVVATNTTTANTGFIFEIDTGKIYRWNGTAFRFTTRQFHLPDWQPFLPDRLIFIVQNADKENGTLKYQVKYEDGNWERETRVDLRYQPGDYTFVTDDLAAPRNVRKFQVRLADLSANKYIKEIRFDSQTISLDDYSE